MKEEEGKKVEQSAGRLLFEAFRLFCFLGDVKTRLWCLVTFKWHPESEERQKALHVSTPPTPHLCSPPTPHRDGVTEIFTQLVSLAVVLNLNFAGSGQVVSLQPSLGFVQVDKTTAKRINLLQTKTKFEPVFPSHLLKVCSHSCTHTSAALSPTRPAEIGPRLKRDTSRSVERRVCSTAHQPQKGHSPHRQVWLLQDLA